MCIRDSGDLVDLLIEKPFLTLPADGDTLKLAVSHDDGVVVTGGNTGAELLDVYKRQPFRQ